MKSIVWGSMTVLVLTLGCAKTGGSHLPDVSLPTVSSSGRTNLASCPTPKCLTVYVAPWCGYCRASTQAIIALKEFLKGHNVWTRVVVGLDGEGSVRQYAREFGPDTLVDPQGAFKVSGGVPHFFVSNAAGTILKDVAGVPTTASSLSEFAAVFDLP